MNKIGCILLLMVGSLTFAQNTNNPNVISTPTQETSTLDLHIYEVSDVPPEFPAGISKFRKAVMDSFDAIDFDTPGYLDTVVTFVIERDGSLTGVKATGLNDKFNREATRAVKSIKKKWKPAEINGQPIRFKMKLPLSMYVSSVQKL